LCHILNNLSPVSVFVGELFFQKILLNLRNIIGTRRLINHKGYAKNYDVVGARCGRGACGWVCCDDKKTGTESVATPEAAPVTESVLPIIPEAGVVPTTATAVNTVKDFAMTAYYDEKGVWFSLKEMVVKKGDTVRMTITNTKGMHNLTIDEFGVATELPLGQPIVVEFTASKTGDFVYYCSIPGHRAKGQWGTLHVTE
jgi:plastocyanin